MRRRLLRIVVLSVVVPIAIREGERLADRLETSRGPSPASRLIRTASRTGRRYYGR